nr:bi-domain-containing oxidoreductase [Pseudomonas sp. RIT-PI-S]
MSGLPLYQRALKQPDNVRRVLDMMRDQGVKRTMDRVFGKLSAGSATGYSVAGVVVEVGQDVEGFSVGDRVACAGAGIANHAEFVDVPVNLAVRIPDELDTGAAATVTLGAIALQGVRRCQPTLGETIVVVGLGILGQLTAQMLKANGCKVIGVDLDTQRVNMALENGMDVGFSPASEDYVERVSKHTGGIGADAVIITAATPSHEVISHAMHCCRKKGRVVLVGDVGLNLNRADFYQKELDFLISSSYGPGRYDPYYEEGGQDYPIGYVRWTENRNMQAYLELLVSGRVRLDKLAPMPYPIDKAGEAYQYLQGDGEKSLLVLLEYAERPTARNTHVGLRPLEKVSGKVRVGLVGASSFAQGMHLPNMVKLRDRYALHAVQSRTGANAKAVAIQYAAQYCTSSYDDVLKDPDIDLLMITTRHHLHASMTLAGLQAGKHVFVEKPLALTVDELTDFQDFYVKNPRGPLLMVGFNRRFSPAIKAVSKALEGRTTPLIINYRMNAGYIPKDHWVHGPEGGGRNLGEACHIYDLFCHLTGTSQTVSIHAAGISPPGPMWRSNENFVAVIKFSDGSVCTLTYTSMGDKSYPKERMEIFSDGKVVVMDDYKSVVIQGGKHKSWTAQAPQKGQYEELVALAETLQGTGPWPITLDEQVQATRIALDVERQLYD